MEGGPDMILKQVSDRDVNRMEVSHLAFNVREAQAHLARAYMSIFGPVVTLELDLPVTTTSGSPIFWMPNALHKASAYYPPGYASDTKQIYRSGQYLMVGATFGDNDWIRRTWTWQRNMNSTFNLSDLLGSPPPPP